MSDHVTTPLRQRPAYGELERHHRAIAGSHLRELFAADSGRGERFVAEGVGLYLDYSKNRITEDTIPLLVQLARESGLREHTEAMFRGDRINVSENRSVLHIALRLPRSASLVVDGVDVVPQVHQVLDRMSAFSQRVRSGEWKGHTGKPMRNVVNIGIGGSDLGPVMAYEALRHFSRRELTFRFVSNVDSTDFVEEHKTPNEGGAAALLLRARLPGRPRRRARSRRRAPSGRGSTAGSCAGRSACGSR